MKIILTLAVLLFSAEGFSNWWEPSWEHILENPQAYRVNAPKINGGLFNLCLMDNGHFKTRHAVRHCAEYKRVQVRHGDRRDWYWTTKCVKWVNRVAYTPRTYTKSKCVRWASEGHGRDRRTYCVERKTTRHQWALHYNIPIDKINEGEWEWWIDKSYSIPNCR